MNTEQERAAFEAWAGVEYRHADKYTKRDYYMGLAAWKAGRAALQSQTAIDDDHLSIVLDVYDNAMQKAFDGREFPNPCKPGTPEHMAWDKGTKEGEKKREAGLPNSIALQSQDRKDAQRYRWLRDNAQIFSHFGGEGNSGWCVMRRDSAITRVFTYNGQELDEAIDHARRVEEGWDG